MEINTYPCLLTSTGNVSPEERQRMSVTDFGDSKLKDRVFVRDSGWFIKLMVCEDMNDMALEMETFRGEGFSSEHLDIIQFALREKIPLIEFDCSADILPGYTIFDE